MFAGNMPEPSSMVWGSASSGLNSAGMKYMPQPFVSADMLQAQQAAQQVLILRARSWCHTELLFDCRRLQTLTQMLAKPDASVHIERTCHCCCQSSSVCGTHTCPSSSLWSAGSHSEPTRTAQADCRLGCSISVCDKPSSGCSGASVCYWACQGRAGPV
jgi:hypothetical protein